MRDGSTRDSLTGSSEIGSDAFTSNFRYKKSNFNQITQHIHNNNNKITIIIKHNDGPQIQQNIAPQLIYIQPATSQPNMMPRMLATTQEFQISDIYNSLDDLDTEEHYQFYNESAVDVPDDFKRNSYLVLNLNDASNKRLKRRICTPTRTLTPVDNPNYSSGANSRNVKVDHHKNQQVSWMNQLKNWLKFYSHQSMKPKLFPIFFFCANIV